MNEVMMGMWLRQTKRGTSVVFCDTDIPYG